LSRHLAWSQILTPDVRGILARDEADSLLERMRKMTTDCDPADPMNRILAFDLQYGLPGDMLYKVDLASMYHALEVRVPFLDREVVDLVTAWPSRWKVDGATTKAILVEAYRDVLPEEVLLRPKQGFEVPVGEFFRNELHDMFRDVVTRDVVDSLGLLDYDAIVQAFDAHCARRAEHADLLFALLSLCWWRGRE
jgi:asparagine synthase (glutamine-hydrolysing)